MSGRPIRCRFDGSHELRGDADEGGEGRWVWPELEDLDHLLWVQGGKVSKVVEDIQS